MNILLKAGRGLPFGKGEQVNMLTSYQDLSSRPIELDKYVLACARFLRYGRNDGRKICNNLLMVFCVLFTGLLASPAFGQEANGLRQLPNSEAVAKAKMDFTIPFSFFMEFRTDSLIEKKMIEEHPEIDFQRYPYVFYEVRKGSIPSLPVGSNIDDFVLDMPLWIANDSLNREVVTLRELGADGKIVVLDFWARWCSPCLASAIRWEQLHNDLKNEICVVSVNVDVDFWAIKNVKARSWKNTQIIGPAAFFLSNYFLGYTLVGPNVWLKNNRFFGASKATQKSYDFIDRLISGEIDEIPEENRDESRYKNYSPLAK